MRRKKKKVRRMSGADGRVLKKIVMIGPVYPFNSGISHYTGLLVKALRKKYEVEPVSFSMQYPKFMFKKEQRDYSDKTFAVEDARYILNTANPFNWIKVAATVKKMKPDLIIVQWVHPYFTPCYASLLSMLRGIPVIITCHNVLPHARFPFDSVLTRSVLKKASGCIVHSKEDESNLVAMLPKMPFRRNPHPTYNAYRIKGMDRDSACKILDINTDEKVLLFFGFVQKYKGLDILINAAPAIVKALDNVRICVVGDFGDKHEEYMSMIGSTGVKEVFMIRDGYVPDAEVEPYFAAADLCVCPYRSATQSGIVQIAFGFGLPVIATNVGGLPEAVTDDKTGYIVAPEDPDALASAVIRFFNENRAGQFRANVKNEEKRFSWERMVETIEDLYHLFTTS